MSPRLRRALRRVVLAAMIVVGLLLCLDVAYLVRGSLEAFPTEEQHDKVRVVTAVLAALLTAGELGLWAALRHLRRGATRHERGAEGARLPVV